MGLVAKIFTMSSTSLIFSRCRRPNFTRQISSFPVFERTQSRRCYVSLLRTPGTAPGLTRAARLHDGNMTMWQPSSRAFSTTCLSAAAAGELISPALTKFSELKLDPSLAHTVMEDMKFTNMTPVQAATFSTILEGHDVLAQAKTGTGKTVAFLLPAIQAMIVSQMQPGKYVSLLVMSPTRELAMQIADEAKKLLKRSPQYKVRLAIGGTNKDREERAILDGCDILVATPGRLHDHLSTGIGDIRAKLQQLKTLVLDEADRLLDMGFIENLKRIVALLPDPADVPRQGMLFSATVPSYVASVARIALRPDYRFVSTLVEGELAIHETVPQNLIFVPTFNDVVPGVIATLEDERAKAPDGYFKAIVFAPTVHLASYYAHILSQGGLSRPIPVHCLHSRLTQSKRSNTTAEFRRAKEGIVVATDVIARGMDFPGVTNVVQVGVPMDKESYIHRLGRTARAGADGRGTLLLTEHEEFFPSKMLKGFPFEAQKIHITGEIRKRVAEATIRLETTTKTKIYQSWLGYYKDCSGKGKIGWQLTRLVQEANEFALKSLACTEIPALLKRTVGKMGLKNVPGIVVAKVEALPESDKLAQY